MSDRVTVKRVRLENAENPNPGSARIGILRQEDVQLEKLENPALGLVRWSMDKWPAVRRFVWRTAERGNAGHWLDRAGFEAWRKANPDADKVLREREADPGFLRDLNAALETLSESP